MPACAGVERPIGTVRCIGRRCDFALDLGAAAEAGIDESAMVELVEHPPVVGEMLGLAPHLAVPAQAEPAQVLQHRLLVLAPAAADVDVLDAHQEAAGRLACTVPADPGRVGAAEIQLPGRTRGETRDDSHFPTLQRRRAPCYAR